MPIDCPGGEKARYRYAKNKARLAFCGNEAVEVKTPQGEIRHPKRKTERRQGRSMSRR